MAADLKSIPLFHGVQESDLRALAERTVTRSYPKQAIIVNEGDQSDSLYLILAGRVKIYLADQNGKELVLAFKGSSRRSSRCSRAPTSRPSSSSTPKWRCSSSTT
jgi:CRP/FNR family cyclic AMP-dependent transcriptional regulator